MAPKRKTAKTENGDEHPKRNRPSGMGSNSRRFAKARHPETLEEIKIVASRAVATIWYVANPDGTWPERKALEIDNECSWMHEGDYLEYQDMRPGHDMGNIILYRIAEVRNRVREFPGKYGQAMRRVLLVPVADADLIGDLDPSELEAGA